MQQLSSGAYFSHWMAMLRIGVELASIEITERRTYMGRSASAIILTHTSFDSFMNETFQGASLASTSKEYDDFANLKMVYKFRLICELTGTNVDNFPCWEDIASVNSTRNYCVHHSSLGRYSKLRDKFRLVNDIFSDYEYQSLPTDEVILNSRVAGWCLDRISDAVIFFESTRTQKSPFSTDNIEFCRMLRRAL